MFVSVCCIEREGSPNFTCILPFSFMLKHGVHCKVKPTSFAMGACDQLNSKGDE